MKCLQATLMVLLLFSFSVITAMSAGPHDDAHYRLGLRAVEAGDARKAVDLFSRAITANPNDHRLYNDRGVAYKRSGDIDRALSDYNRSLEIKPDYANALNNRGVAYLQQGEYDKAIVDFNEALKYGGIAAKLYTNLGIAYATKGDHVEAVKQFRTACAFRPIDPRAFFFMGRSLEELGDLPGALKMYRLASGMIKDQPTESFIDKKIAALTQNVGTAPQEPAGIVGAQPPSSTAAASTPAQKWGAEKAPSKKREVVLRPTRPQQTAPEVLPPSPPVQFDPTALEAANGRSRARARQTFSPAAAEIFQQGLDFMERKDPRKALIRFEDVLQLEKRRKNAKGAAWCMVEIGRAGLRIGDFVRASSHLEGAAPILRKANWTEETILALLELAAVQRALNKPDKAAAFIAQASHEATAAGPQQVALLTQPTDSKNGEPPQARTASATATPVKIETEVGTAPVPAKVLPTMQTPRPAPESAKGSQARLPEVAGKTEKREGVERKPTIWGKAEDRAESAKPAVVGPKTDPEKRVAARPLPPETAVAPQPQKAIQEPKKPLPESPLRGETLQAKGTERLQEQLRKAATPQVKEARRSTEPQRNAENRQARGKTQAPETTAARRSESAPQVPPAKTLAQDLADLKRYRGSGDELSMIVVLERIAAAFSQSRQYAKALLSLEASTAFREKLRLTKDMDRLLQDRGNLRVKMGDKAGALEDFTRGEVLLNQKGMSAAAAVLADKARTLAGELGLEPNAAVKALEDLWSARAVKDRKREVNALLAVARLYDRAERPAEALNYYERCSAAILADKARLLEKIGRKKLASESYTAALQAFKKLDYSGYLGMLNSSGSAEVRAGVPRGAR
ncbi:MAG: tetratricopeptide repeat protein [Desulfomonile tiedjei]|nr:tetratricopeptide repeat protein [Desulfomonile tiedjei]